MTNYPQDIFNAFNERRITKSDFILKFGRWQKESGIDYSCKGTADRSGVHITYRNITATIKNGTLHFTTDTNDEASDFFEFRRKVDFYREQKKQGNHRKGENAL